MRRRTRQYLVTLIGIVVILTVLGSYRSWSDWLTTRSALIQYQDAVEREKTDLGIQLLDWETLRSVQTGKEGVVFPEELVADENALVHLVGYIVPIPVQFKMNEFLLQPLPSKCYLFGLPPITDAVYVQLTEGALESSQSKLSPDKPLLIHGLLRLNREPGRTFRYALVQAGIDQGAPGPRIPGEFFEVEEPDDETTVAPAPGMPTGMNVTSAPDMMG